MQSGREQLKAWIERSGYKRQRDAADLFGLYESLLSMILSGKRDPTIEQAATIEEKTGIPMRAWAIHSLSVLHKGPKARQPRSRKRAGSQDVKALS